MNLIRVALIGFMLLMPYVIQDGYAHGVISIKDCNMKNLDYNQELYREDIIGLNQATSFYVEAHPGYTMKELSGYMDNVYLNQPVELAHCLRDLGINPASVAQVSNLAYSGLVYDRAQLQGYSPNFLKEIPAPQAGNIHNIIPLQNEDPVKESIQAQVQQVPVEPLPLQAQNEPVHDILQPMQNHQQIPLEYVFISIAIAAVIGIAIAFGRKPRKENRIMIVPQR